MLIRQTLLYLPAQVLGPLFLFVSVIVWTHLLDPTELGLYALVTATQELANVAMLSWFSYWTLRYVTRFGSEAEARRYLDTEAPIVVAAGLASALAGALVLTVVGDEPHSVWLFLATAAHVASRTVTAHLGDRARSQGDIVTYTVLSVTGPVLGLAIGYAIAVAVKPSAAAALAGLAIAQVLAIAIALRRMRFGRVVGPIDRELLASALRYGLPFLLSGPLVWASVNGIRFLVEFVAGSVAVGLMTVGWALGQRGAAVASTATTAAAFPLAIQRTREHGSEEGRQQLARNATLLFLLLAPAMGGLYAVARELVEVLVAAPYRDSTLAILPWAAAAGTMLSLRAHFTNQVYLLAEKPRVALAVDAIDTTATLVLCLAGLLAFGITGAAAGAAVGSAVGLAASTVHGLRHYDLRLPLADMARIMAATGVMILALKLIPYYPGVMALIARIALGAVIYAGALLVLMPRALLELRQMLSRLSRR